MQTAGTRTLSAARAKARAAVAAALAVAALVVLHLCLASPARAEIVHFEEPYSPINGTGDAVLQAPTAIAIDEETGNVFVGETNSRNQVSILGAQGGAPAGLVSPFKVTGFTAGNFLRAGAVAYDDNPASPGFGNLYVPDATNANIPRAVKIFRRNPVAELYELTGELVPDPIVSAQPRPFGVAIDPEGSVWVADTNEKAVIKFDPATGDELMRIDMLPVFPHNSSNNAGSPEQIAFNATGDMFVMESPRFAPPFPRVAKWFADESGEIDPDEEPTYVPDTAGAWGMTIDRDENHLYIAFADRVVQYDAESLEKLGEFGKAILDDARGVAVNETNGRVYVTDQGAKDVKVFGPSIRTATVEVSDASGVGTTVATLNGSVSAQGTPLEFCRFEYGTSDEYGESIDCAGFVPPNMATHQVSAQLTGLEPNTTYHFRLVARNASGITSTTADATLTTKGKPRISGTVPIWVDRNTAKLGAYINPSGFSTHYRFEWGPTDDYGHTVPADFEPSIPGGTERVKVVANLSGLNQAKTYHFRVVATNAFGTTFGPDQRFETLNSCGFIQNRCLELVSSGDKGFLGNAGEVIASQGLFMQAADSGSSVFYPLTYGYEDATVGGEVIYGSTRGENGWTHEQISPESGPPSSRKDGYQSRILGFSRDMSCHAFLSRHLLTSDSPRSTAEEGYANMYLRDRDGALHLVTTRPIDLAAGAPVSAFMSVRLVGISDDCGKVVFQSEYRYVGLPGLGTIRLYEWDRETKALRAISAVPGQSGPEVVAVNPGAGSTVADLGSPFGFERENRFNSVASDGGRVFFTAQRKLVGGPGGADEVGKLAVFAQTDENQVLDISKSQTSTPNRGARYQLASRDGSKVLFIANHGLTRAAEPSWSSTCDFESGEGCDLYEYDFSREPGERLVALSHIDGLNNAGGAGVLGVVAASEDATSVYFLARGRLVPGEGPSEATNLQNNTYSLYLRSSDTLQYVGTVRQADTRALLVNDNGSILGSWLAQTTSSGSHLVFPARADVTGDDPSEARQAYLFDAGTGRTVCVSCLRDGGEPVVIGDETVLQRFSTYSPKERPRRAITDDGRSVYFTKQDVLAPGALAGQPNLYEWRDGQISYLGSSFRPRGLPGTPQNAIGIDLTFIGASADGKDVFFITRDRLNWEDEDDLTDVYSARRGGGFPEPPPVPASCEGEACLGPAAPAPAEREIGSVAFVGDGNLPAAPERKGTSVRVSKLRPVRGAVARLKVRVPDAGRVSVNGRAIRRSVRSASKAGVYSIRIALKGKARRLLKKRSVLRVRARIAFRASDGSSASSVVRLTFRQPHARRAAARRGGR